MSQYITRDEAQSEIERLVKEQLDTFSAQKKVMAEHSRRLEEQSRKARHASAKLAIGVHTVLKAQCESQIAQQVGDLRIDGQAAVTTVNTKIAEIDVVFQAQTSSQENGDLNLGQHVADMVPARGQTSCVC